MPLVTAPIVKNSDVKARIYLIFLKIVLKQTIKRKVGKNHKVSKYYENYCRVEDIRLLKVIL